MPKFRRPMLAMASLSLLAFASLGLAACGGDDDDGGSSGGSTSGGTGSDEAYVATICKATANFLASVEKTASSASQSSKPEDQINAFVKPMEAYLKEIKTAKPPADIREFHQSTVTNLENAIKSLKEDGDFNAIDEFDIPEPPAKVADRLQKVAEKNDDCVKAELNFSE